MTALYAFMFLAGAPLLLWFAFGGGETGAEGDADSGVFSLVSLSTLSFVGTFFGATGLASTWLGASSVGGLVLAITIGVSAGFLNSTIFGWLRRNEVSSEISNREIEGTIGRVVLPVSARSRGRIVLEVSGAHTQMTAELVDSSDVLDAGESVIVVRISSGVAMVTPLDPDLK